MDAATPTVIASNLERSLQTKALILLTPAREAPPDVFARLNEFQTSTCAAARADPLSRRKRRRSNLELSRVFLCERNFSGCSGNLLGEDYGRSAHTTSLS